MLWLNANMQRLILGFSLILLACGGSVGDPSTECTKSSYELEKTRYRCIDTGELQTLECGEWITLEICIDSQSCSPGPNPGCDQ